jgi:hypothetical protein
LDNSMCIHVAHVIHVHAMHGKNLDNAHAHGSSMSLVNVLLCTHAWHICICIHKYIYNMHSMHIHDNICTYTCICTCTWHTHVPCMAMHIPRTYQVQLMDMVTLMMDNVVNQAAKWRLMLGGDAQDAPGGRGACMPLLPSPNPEPSPSPSPGPSPSSNPSPNPSPNPSQVHACRLLFEGHRVVGIG